MSDDRSGQEDLGSPLIWVFGTDTPEALVVRVYEEMLDLGWDEGVVRAAFQLMLKRSGEGRPVRQRLEPSERHMLHAWDLWPKRPRRKSAGTQNAAVADSAAPDHGTNDKLGFAKYWFEEKHRGQSVDANRKLLNRLIKFRDKNA